MIDYASINFIDQSQIKRLGFHTWSVAGCSVTVANGDKILVVKQLNVGMKFTAKKLISWC